MDGARLGSPALGPQSKVSEYHQSRRGAIYARHSATLDAGGLTYPCLLHAARVGPLAQGAAGRRPAAALRGHLPRAIGGGACPQKSAAGHLADHAVPRAHREVRRVRRLRARVAEIRHRRHRRLHPAARRRQRRLLFQQCHRRRRDGRHARIARRGSPDQYAATAPGARGTASCARRPTDTCRCSWVPTARRSRSATAPSACASFANVAIYPVRIDKSPVPARAFDDRNGVLDARADGAPFRRQTSRPRAGALRRVAAHCVAARGRAAHAARRERALARIGNPA